MPYITSNRGIKHQLYVVILVGGMGKRLRPLSNEARPKAFLSVTRDRKTMFRRTLDMAKRIAGPGNVVVVANRKHVKLVKKDFPEIAKENLITESVSRNTAPAITLAAFRLFERRGDVTMVILPTDQYVLDQKEYIGAIKRGIRFLNENDNALVVLGVKPGFPSTEYGYMKLKGRISAPWRISKVESFVEKPNRAAAKKYMRTKGYLWNAGGFIFKAHAILRAIEKFAPRIIRVLGDLERSADAYRNMPDISIDYAVMEKADNIYCVEGSYRWRDMGSFEALESILTLESRGFIKKRERIIKIL